MKRALAMISALLLVSAATAATYYVSPAGNDNNTGTSDAPVRTISKGISKATAAGDIVSVADGDYEIGAKITVSQAITIRGNVDDCSKVVVNCKGTQHALYNDSVDGWSVSGFTFTNIYRVVYSKKAVTVSHCVFRDVKSGSTLGGEALCFPAGTDDGLKVVEDCLFDNLYSGGKGAIYLDNTFPITIRRCVFRGCYGGGVRKNSDTGTIELTAEDCEFSDCGGWGGAVNLMANNKKTQYFRNCLFARNDATPSGNTACGSAVSTKNSFGIYENCTFADNTCSLSMSTSAAAVYANGGSSTFVNCIFWNNLHMNGSGGPVTAETSVSGTYTATNCAASAASPLANGTDNKALSASPFAAAGVYTLAGEDNPCLGAGVKLDWMTEDSKDLAGNPRLRGNNIVDLGCYEFVETGSFKGFLMLID